MKTTLITLRITPRRDGVIEAADWPADMLVEALDPDDEYHIEIVDVRRVNDANAETCPWCGQPDNCGDCDTPAE